MLRHPDPHQPAAPRRLLARRLHAMDANHVRAVARRQPYRQHSCTASAHAAPGLTRQPPPAGALVLGPLRSAGPAAAGCRGAAQRRRRRRGGVRHQRRTGGLQRRAGAPSSRAARAGAASLTRLAAVLRAPRADCARRLPPHRHAAGARLPPRRRTPGRLRLRGARCSPCQLRMRNVPPDAAAWRRRRGTRRGWHGTCCSSQSCWTTRRRCAVRACGTLRVRTRS
jgi:hypothetical protein